MSNTYRITLRSPFYAKGKHSFIDQSWTELCSSFAAAASIALIECKRCNARGADEDYRIHAIVEINA